MAWCDDKKYALCTSSRAGLNFRLKHSSCLLLPVTACGCGGGLGDGGDLGRVKHSAAPPCPSPPTPTVVGAAACATTTCVQGRTGGPALARASPATQHPLCASGDRSHVLCSELARLALALALCTRQTSSRGSAQAMQVQVGRGSCTLGHTLNGTRLNTSNLACNPNKGRPSSPHNFA